MRVKMLPERVDQRTLEAFVDHFIIGLIRKAGLKVKVRRTPATTTLSISLRRAEG
jgi:hypothetical protein